MHYIISWVLELDSVERQVWVWPINEENWPIVRNEKKWAVDTELKSKTVKKGDTIIFYVRSEPRTYCFQGIYKVQSGWEKSITSWNDRDTILEIELEKVESGYADVRKLEQELEFITGRKDSRGSLGLALKGTSKGPCNNGNPITEKDYEKILNEMKSNKSPPPLGDVAEESAEPPQVFNSKLKNPNIRLFLVKSLFENLMGPKNGPNEEIENPSFSYVVGVLKTKFAPRENMVPNDPSQETKNIEKPSKLKSDFDLENLREETISADQDLNPVLGARNIGISFVVEGDSPRVSLCFTWGRYSKSAISSRLWRRDSNFFTCNVNLSKKVTTIFPKDGASSTQRITKEGAEIRIDSHRLAESSSKYKVSVFLVNNTKFEGYHPTAAEEIYQPQIRIVTLPETSLSQLETLQESGMDSSQKLLFNERKIFASGHFCGALWNELDPEDYEDELGFSTFTWPDSFSKYFPMELRKKFTRPDARTEYFPSYSILQPDLKEMSRVNFNADKLADMWDGKSLSEHLSEMLNRYNEWISLQNDELKKLELKPDLNAEAMGNIERCKKIAVRIDKGIKFLYNDEKARTAFCFMNKVMSIKMRWEGIGNGHESFSWWEYQMAFILHCLVGVAQKDLDERDVCDILWFPTGGGKTEAYLGLMIFATAYRRLADNNEFETDGGVSVISRYTLRLLTIQQFQRTLGVVVAADFLRVTKWKPKGIKPTDISLKQSLENDILWGKKRFSIGLWIGGGATPNKFADGYNSKDKTPILYAKGMLKEKPRRYQSQGEPAQIQNCPCCSALLSVPSSETSGLEDDSNTIYWIFESAKSLSELNAIATSRLDAKMSEGIEVESKEVFEVGKSDDKKFYSIMVRFRSTRSANVINESKIIRWWKTHVSVALSGNPDMPARLLSTSAANPGYFYVNSNGEQFDFVIHCPNQACELNKDIIWYEKDDDAPFPPIPKPFRIDGEIRSSRFFPISAYTTDEQIYRRCPTVLISTVDKFALLPYFSDFSSLFGNVDACQKDLGYGRTDISNHIINSTSEDVRTVKPFLPPSLIIQDELHLIEGPLGSIVGIYEIAIEILSSTPNHKPKYVASSATIKESKSQVGSIFRRRVSVFPPQGISIEDNYFSENKEDRKSLTEKAGRLYLGVSAPNKLLVVPVRIWATLLGEIYKIRKNPQKYFLDKKFSEQGERHGNETFTEYVQRITDPYWTLIGYFNAKKELQITRNLYGDDIARDIRLTSSEQFSSIQYREKSLRMQPLIRFIPIKVSFDSTINSVSVFTQNSSGRISVVLYDNKENEFSPRKIIANVKEEDRIKKCEKGSNDFQLSENISIKKDQILWVAIVNDDNHTAFQTGKGEKTGFSLQVSDEEIRRIMVDYHFPASLTKIAPENITLNVSLSTVPRDIGFEPIELTGQTDSQELPHILSALNITPANEIDSVFTTAVFGTGIDVPRLGLMAVMGQPKTTSTYIQSTGRVGRRSGGLVVTWLKASNIRDLNHYENFVGYHRLIQHFIEPVSASPYSDVTMKSCLGPISVGILRNGRMINSVPINKNWIPTNSGPMLMRSRNESNEIKELVSELTKKISDKNIPDERRIDRSLAEKIIKNTINLWYKDAENLSRDGQNLLYNQWTMLEPATENVVLGSPPARTCKKNNCLRQRKNVNERS